MFGLVSCQKNKPTSWIRGVYVFCFLSVFLWGCSQSSVIEVEETAAPVRMVSVEEGVFQDEVRVQGTLEAQHFALVPARVGGTVEQLLVDEGDLIQVDRPLCILDRKNLQQVVITHQKEVAVASSSLEVARADLENARAQDNKARLDNERYQRLVKEEAVTVDLAEQIQTRFVATEAAVRSAAARVNLSQARLAQAEAALSIARKNLADATIRAPIEGVVSQRYLELGEMAKAGKPVFRIDDPRTLEFCAYLSGSYYDRVQVGKTLVRLKASGKEVGSFPISYCSPTVNEKLRTFEIKCLFESLPGLAPGMMAEGEVILASRPGRGVPADCLVRRGQKMVLFIVSGNEAQVREVTPGYRSGNLLEIVEGLGPEVDRVVGLGQRMLDPGDRVRILGEAD